MSASPVAPPREILAAFLRLGCTSFGGPVAHLGYFRTEFVERRRWLSEAAYADLVALAQFLPGPASSQVGFAIGLGRGGLIGGLTAWLGFTLPSALLMLLFAAGAEGLAHWPAGTGLLHGLELAAVAIVAQAVLGMARGLCPDRPRAAIATAALLAALAVGGSLTQVAIIAAGGLAGLWLCGGDPVPVPQEQRAAVPRALALAALALFAALLALSFLPWSGSGAAAVFAAFYRSGGLVFGGGHVVLPLLRDSVVVPGWVSESAFLAGYGAAQAMPGPLFTIAAYLGATMAGVAGATIAVVAIFLPGLLCLLAALPFWHALRARPWAQAALRGTNAAVVGLLGAALYDPVWTRAVLGRADFAIAAAGFVLLVAWRAPPLSVVLLAGGVSAALRLATAA
jgi:chromate transporter